MSIDQLKLIGKAALLVLIAASVILAALSVSGCALNFPVGEKGKYGYVEARVMYYPRLPDFTKVPEEVPKTLGDK